MHGVQHDDLAPRSFVCDEMGLYIIDFAAVSLKHQCSKVCGELDMFHRQLGI
jgi:tRNA A-37 threonylcarbamoyl transferase component Bud32